MITCAMCFRTVQERDSFYLGQELERFMQHTCKACAMLLALARNLDNPWHTCCQCNTFVQRKRSKVGRQTLPMEKTLRYLLSGGATCKPDCRSMELCLNALLQDFPTNPLFQLFGLVLRDLVHTLQQSTTTRQISKSKSIVPLLHWRQNGCQPLLQSRKVAKRLRKELGGAMPPHNDETFPSPCRHCCKEPPHPPMACSALLPAELRQIEEQEQVVPNVTAFCLQCRHISVLSFAFDSATRSQPFATATAYYTHQVGLFRNVKSLFLANVEI